MDIVSQMNEITKFVVSLQEKKTRNENYKQCQCKYQLTELKWAQVCKNGSVVSWESRCACP